MAKSNPIRRVIAKAASRAVRKLSRAGQREFRRAVRRSSAGGLLGTMGDLAGAVQGFGTLPGYVERFTTQRQHAPQSISDVVEQYARSFGGGRLGRAMSGWRSFGRIVDAILGVQGKSSPTPADVQAAVSLLQSVGIPVGSVVPPPIRTPPGRPPRPPRGPTTDAPLPGGSDGEDGGNEPAGPLGTTTSRRTPRGAPPLPGEVGAPTEILTPQSSNVYSFSFEPDSSKRKGTLFITYKANAINASYDKATGHLRGSLGSTVGKKKNAPGAKYEYLDVPTWVYVGMQKAASKGKFVWDKIRIRGTIHGHKYRYGLVSGIIAPYGGTQGGIYVPRRATAKGFKNRALAAMGTGRRGFTVNTLPSQTFTTRRK